MTPAWLGLFAPLPPDVAIERKAVASAELLAAGKADAIAGWESIAVYLSDIDRGMRHVLITIDGDGTLLSGGDTVMFHHDEVRGEEVWHIYDHESVGGRFEPDGSFRGTRWQSRAEHAGDEEEPRASSATPSPPSDADEARLRALVTWVLERAPARR
jgi:hypothetical protein